MSTHPAVSASAATLLEADPSLGSLLTLRELAARGHLAVLPVLTVRVGAWAPPPRSQLGTDTVALTVLDGMVLGEAELFGPGDVLEPWDAGAWTACTALRLAVIGSAYAGALREWPTAGTRLRLRSNAGVTVPPMGGDLRDRLLEFLWRVALRHGVSKAAGVGLPAALDVRALHLILDLPELDLALALAELQRLGAIDHERPAWILGGHPQRFDEGPHARRDELLARAAHALAIARAGRENTYAVSELLELRERVSSPVPRPRRGTPG